MKKIILFCPIGMLYLWGCSHSPRATTQVQGNPIPKPLHTSTSAPKPTLIKLDPKFRFVIKDFEFERQFDSKTQQEAVAMDLLLGYQGPKPTWWGKGVYELLTVTCVTENGQKFIGAGSPETSVVFYEEHNPGQFRTSGSVVVPGLKKSMRVTKIEMVHNIVDAGLVQVDIPIPANQQLK